MLTGNTDLWTAVAERNAWHSFEPAEEPTARANMRAELDVYVARDLFGLTKYEMQYILDPSSVLGEECGVETFGALKRSEIRSAGRFVTYDLVMEAWDRLPRPAGLP